MQHVYIGLGSNLDEPEKQIERAVVALRNLPETRYVKDSGLFLSKPLLSAVQQSEKNAAMPDYYNAVALLKTRLEPLLLLDMLQAIEQKQGRIRAEHWGARTLDLDILLFGDMQISSDRLQLPHPGLCEREFVLYPLQAIEAQIDIPGHGKLDQCIKKCARNGLLYMGSIGGVR